MGRLKVPQPGDGMYYVLKGPVQVDKDDLRYPGDPVPEAFNWRKAPAMVNQRILQFIPSKLPEPPKKKEPEKEAPLAEAAPAGPAQDPGLDAADTSKVAPSPSLPDSSKSGAISAKPSAKPKPAPK